MDVAEINKVAGRKRMSADVEKLREKVSREKLKVSQDTAYWDLQEKLRQVETNHKKLQQNMLEVQMQYELRQREETLNKLASTREICSLLEDYSERLRDTLSRCKTDQAALYDAYQTSGHMLRDLRNQQVQQQERDHQTISTLEVKLKLMTEHQNLLLQYFTKDNFKQNSINELKEMKEKLSIAVAQNNESQKTHIDCRRDLEQKEEDLRTLQSDITEVIRQFNSQANELKNEMRKKEKGNPRRSTRLALLNQETVTESICEQGNQCLEQAETNAEKIVKELENKLKEASLTNHKLTSDLEKMEDKNIELEKQIACKNEQINNTKQQLKMLEDQLSTLDLEKRGIVKDLEKAGEEAQILFPKITQLTETAGKMAQKIKDIEDAMKTSKANSEKKLKELTDAIEAKNKEIENKTSCISHLMNQVKTVSDDRAKLENIVEKLQQELREKQDTAAEKEKRLSMRIEQLDDMVKSKDKELSKNLSIILELRSDNERLNVEIEGLEKEMTRSAIKQPRIEPDLDDNAVMLTPPSKRNTQNNQCFPTPPPSRPKGIKDDSLLNFLSDDSMDGDQAINSKDKELSKNLSIILELRSDNKRLNVEIEGLEKEMTRSAIKQPRIEPDLDDNAVMLTPSSKRNTQNNQCFPTPPPSQPKGINDDSLLYNFLSDDSMDGDHAINARYGNRRIEARSRARPLTPIVKCRRDGAPGSQGGLRLKQSDNDNKALSRKDNKFFKTKRNKTK